MRICVPPDDALEIRCLEVTNQTRLQRSIEITTYLEVVLDRSPSYAAHLAFSKLFVETEFVPSTQSLLARRRPRSNDEKFPYLFHVLAGDNEVEVETDRARFLGRGGRTDSPVALRSRARLSGTTGGVLDPVLSLRRVVHLEAGETAVFSLLLGAEPTRAEALATVARWTRAGAVDSAFKMASSHAVAQIDRFGLTAGRAEFLQALAGAVLYRHPSLRATPAIVARARGTVLDLVRFGVRPGRAMVLFRADDLRSTATVTELIAVCSYWRDLDLPIDLVIVSPAPETFPSRIEPLAPDGLTVLGRADLSEGDVDRLEAAADWVVGSGFPDLSGSPDGSSGAPHLRLGGGVPGELRAAIPSRVEESLPFSADPLAFSNEYGGFSEDGREYVIRMPYDGEAAPRRPPLPWVNVVANERFGFMVSEAGSICTWSQNSRRNRLTPWYNDPVSDPHEEALYLLDHETGAVWSPLPGPAPAAAGYEMRHGFGYSVCRHSSHDLDQETLLFVPGDDPVRITRVRLTNRAGRPRNVSLYSYCRLVLGTLPEESARFVVTENGPSRAVVLARNRAGGEFADGVAFVAALGVRNARAASFTTDREEFIGRLGSTARPAVLERRAPLRSRVGAGIDPCAAHEVLLEIGAGETAECVFLLGQAGDVETITALLDRYRTADQISAALEGVKRSWERVLGGIRVKTPDPALDIMINGWLVYQNVSCRLRARSAYYQSGGAYGFRDQLQDAAALVHLAPAITRSQILLHAAHQFEEGDVLHWWHPPISCGIRTRCSDDRLWLPLVVAHYVRTTGDLGVLDETVRFLTAPPLAPDQDEAFVTPSASGHGASLYEHCCRAIDRSFETGEHGLPLFGSCDWNDGMNRVGREGRGESVWMGFFLIKVLDEFIPICERFGEGSRAREYHARIASLRAALNDAGWDGEWYRRGYYDDGAPLGSRDSDECRIDALVQAWSVLSGAASPERANRAMDAVERYLISDEDGLIRLLTPPFDSTTRDPGYIKGYLPGIRENGGQYTHAALWVVQAMAELGRRDRAAALLGMLCPIRRALTPEQVAVYRVEPYVVAADIYGEPPHIGRGGWTWYTGSAGWMYRVAIETVLGFRMVGGRDLALRPRVPDSWPACRITYRVPGTDTTYEIHVKNPLRDARVVVSAALDGEPARVQEGEVRVPIVRDGRVHRVDVVLGGVSA